MPSSETQATALPDDLLIPIFDLLTRDIDTGAVYTQLTTLQLVCKQWWRLARKTIYSRVEVVGTRNATSLANMLEKDPTMPIDILVAGISGSYNGFMDNDQFKRLLSLLPNLRKLVVLHANSSDHDAAIHAPVHLPPLPFLRDVTVLSATSIVFTLATGAFVFGLPRGVRFLQLPGFGDACDGLESYEVSFRLYGLTIQNYPSPMANRVLALSRSSLQMLTVCELRDCSQLAENHPNLRSLRILEARDNNHRNDYRGLYKLKKMERLELREIGAEMPVLRTLPDSLLYLRFWSTDIALGLVEMLADSSERTIPKLQTVVWDYWDVENESLGGTLGLLEQVCKAQSISFSASQRPRYNPRTSVEADLPYEAAFRASFFKMDQETRPVFLPACIRKTSTPFPSIILSRLLSNSIPITPLLAGRPNAARFEPILDNSFEGHSQWLEAFYKPWMGRETVDHRPDSPRPEFDPGWTVGGNIRRALSPGPILLFCFSVASIFSAAIALTFTIFRHDHVVRLALPFGSSVVIHTLAWIRHRYNDEGIPLPTIAVLRAKTFAGLLAMGLGACMFTVIPHSGKLELELGIIGGVLSIAYGVWSFYHFGDLPYRAGDSSY